MGIAFASAVVALALASLTGAAAQTSGSLDPTFGAAGTVTTRIGGQSGVNALALQSDGKIVAAGFGEAGSPIEQSVFGVARYGKNGALDTGFGTGGTVTTPIGRDDEARGVAVQKDGKIVVAGTTQRTSASWLIAVARYTRTGQLDPTFGSGGIVKTALGGGHADAGLAVAVQPDGRIVVAGYNRIPAQYDVALVRYNPDGSLDQGFGLHGIVRTAVGSELDLADSLALQRDGKIVVAGSSQVASSHDVFAVLRYNRDGSLDTTFGSGGKVTTAIGSRDDEAHALALQPDGAIVVAGESYTETQAKFALVRYTSTGELDSTFGTGGIVTTAVGAQYDEVSGLVVQLNGKIVAVGHSVHGSAQNEEEFALARYDSNGTLDPTFGSGGIVESPIGTLSEAYAAALQPDGKIVAGGISDDRFALARFAGDPTCIAPQLKGKSTRSAKAIIRRAHCSVGRVRKAFSRRVRAGRVISQTPKPGTVGRQGTKVSLTISKGKRR